MGILVNALDPLCDTSVSVRLILKTDTDLVFFSRLSWRAPRTGDTLSIAVAKSVDGTVDRAMQIDSSVRSVSASRIKARKPDSDEG